MHLDGNVGHGDRLLQPALADEAPGTDHVGDDVDADRRAVSHSKHSHKTAGSLCPALFRGNQASADTVALTLRYSIDGGKTWTDAASTTVGTGIGRVHDLGGLIPGTIPESRYLQVQVAWDSVSDWAPTLAAISVEYERLGGTKRRRWQIGVIAQDRMVERDGSRHLRSGAEIVADLWQAWETGATVPFRDVDYDADPTERGVRIIGLSEQIPTPSNPAAIATSQITVTLLEV